MTKNLNARISDINIVVYTKTLYLINKSLPLCVSGLFVYNKLLQLLVQGSRTLFWTAFFAPRSPPPPEKKFQSYVLKVVIKGSCQDGGYIYFEILKMLKHQQPCTVSYRKPHSKPNPNINTLNWTEVQV
jgi:hypothetical protein